MNRKNLAFLLLLTASILLALTARPRTNAAALPEQSALPLLELVGGASVDSKPDSMIIRCEGYRCSRYHVYRKPGPGDDTGYRMATRMDSVHNDNYEPARVFGNRCFPGNPFMGWFVFPYHGMACRSFGGIVKPEIRLNV